MVSKSFGHIPNFLEPQPTYEEDNCWNCGGELFIEFPSGQTAFNSERCPMCGGTGYLLSGTMPINFDDWLDNRLDLPLVHYLSDATINWKPAN